MKISVIILLTVLSLASSQQLDEDVVGGIESDLAKIVPKLPQSIKDEIFRSSVGDSSAHYFDVLNDTKKASEQSYIIGDKNTRRYRVKIKKKTRKGGGKRHHTFSNEEYKKSYKLQEENQFDSGNRNAYEYAEENESDKDISDAKEMDQSYTYSDENITTGLSEKQNYDDAKLSLTGNNMMTSDTTENTRQKGVKTICDTLNITSQDISLIAKEYLGLDIHKSEDFHELDNLYKEFVKSIKDGVVNISSFKWFLDNNHKEDTNRDYTEEENYPRNSKQFWKNVLIRISKYLTRGFNNTKGINNILGIGLKTLKSDNIDQSTLNSPNLDRTAIAELDLNRKPKSGLVDSNSLNKKLSKHEVVENDNIEPTELGKRIDTNALIVEESIDEYDEKTLPEEIAERVIRPINKSSYNVGPHNYIDIKTKKETEPNNNNVNEEELSGDENKKYFAAANLILEKGSKLPHKKIKSELSSEDIPDLQIIKTNKGEFIPPAKIYKNNLHNLRDGNNKITKEPSNEFHEIQNSLKKSWFNVIPYEGEIDGDVAKNKYYLLIPALILNPRTKYTENEIISGPTKRKLDDEQNDDADKPTEALTKNIDGLLDIRKPNMLQLYLQLTNDILSDTLKRTELFLIDNSRPTDVIKPVVKRIKSEMLMLTQLSYDATKCLTDNLDLFIEMLKFKIKQHLKL